MTADDFWPGHNQLGEAICSSLSKDPWLSTEGRQRYFHALKRYHAHLQDAAANGMLHYELFCEELADLMLRCLKPNLKHSEHSKLLDVGNLIMIQVHMVPVAGSLPGYEELRSYQDSEAAAEKAACMLKRHWKCGDESKVPTAPTRPLAAVP